MVQAGGESFLMMRGKALKWSPAGYSQTEHRLADPLLLTPPSTLRAFTSGYKPVLHASALV
jgi:hypothetical protein